MATTGYGNVAFIYDLLGDLWTGGQIRQSKLSQIDKIKRGDKILYAGAGTGEDALEAARRGAEVVVVELAPEMLERVRKRFEEAGLQAELICGDLFEHLRVGHYDIVAANYFLNVFGRARMQEMAAHLTTQLKPDGKLLIADFAPPSGGWLCRLGAELHHGIPALAFTLLVQQTPHKIYDYRPILPGLGLQLEEVQYFRLYGFGPRRLMSLTATRQRPL
jgi:ubiquinone/menaquinone biosynthesis C-methylase UbiE